MNEWVRSIGGMILAADNWDTPLCPPLSSLGLVWLWSRFSLATDRPPESWHGIEFGVGEEAGRLGCDAVSSEWFLMFGRVVVHSYWRSRDLALRDPKMKHYVFSQHGVPPTHRHRVLPCVLACLLWWRLHGQHIDCFDWQACLYWC